jgi:glycosyltransferase involved in cell wall biosynthesis
MTELISNGKPTFGSITAKYPELVIDTSLLINSTVSVIIPVRNSEKCIADCLEAIFSQSMIPTEVIIVDGGSTDKTIELVSEFPVTIIHEKYGTVGGARQVGVEKSTGKYVAFTDADCVPEKDWLKNLVNEFDEETLGVGGGILNIGNNFWETSVALSRDTFIGSANSIQGRVFKEKRFVKSISGCNSIYLRDTLVHVGGFNTALSMNEETDLNKRLSSKGKLAYTPNATVIHNQRRGLKLFARQMVEYGRGRGKNKLWDMQCFPPVAIPFLMLSVFFTAYLFPALLIIYTAVLFGIGAKIAVKNKSARYVLSMPIVFVVEHAFYTIGFWKGLFEGLKP